MKTLRLSAGWLFAALSLAACLGACGGSSAPYAYTPVVMASQSFSMPAGGMVKAPPGATVVDRNGNMLTLREGDGVVQVFPGAIVSVPAGLKGDATVTVKAI